MDTRGMRFFISSPMSGRYAQLREAAAGGIKTLGHEPLRAEDHQASPDSPQAACLADVRSADAVVLILGPDYGSVQASGLSATHEEYREARNEAIPVLAFVEESTDPDTAQAEFISEVQDWEQGQYTGTFSNSDDLQSKIIRGLHELLLNAATTPVNEEELVKRAQELIPSQTHNWFSGGPLLVVAVAGSGTVQATRPSELDSGALVGFLQREALTDSDAVLDTSFGTTPSITGNSITLTQQETGASVSLSETGDVAAVLPASHTGDPVSSVRAIIVEDIDERISRALRFIGRVLDHVDKPRRMSQVAVVAAVLGSGNMPWRTREEQAENPNLATMTSYSKDPLEALLTPPTQPRAALVRSSESLSEDLTAILRRKATEQPGWGL